MLDFCELHRKAFKYSCIVTGCACRINDMLFGGTIGGVTRLRTPHDVHLYIELSDRTSILLFFNEVFCMIASH